MHVDIMKICRVMRVVGITLLVLSAGVAVGKLLYGHAKWPAGPVFDLVATAVIGLALLIVAGFVARAESRKRKADNLGRDAAANLDFNNHSG